MINIKVIASSSKGNCYRVDDGKSSLLLECGITIAKIKKALNFKLSEISGCLISHSHLDHCKAIRDIARAGVGVYTSKQTAEATGVKGHRVHYVEPLKQFTIQSWTILPFDTEHDCPGSLGFLLQSSSGEKLLFLTDTAFCKYKFLGITHLMIEANFCDEILQQNMITGVVEGSRRKRLLESHMSIERVKDFLEKNDISQLRSVHLLHLSAKNSDKDQFKLMIQQETGVPVYVAGE